MSENNTVEYYVSSENMDTIRQHRWEVDGCEVHAVQREWTWNYRTRSYSERRNVFTFEITPGGVVEHDGRELPEYAIGRVQTLTNKRGVHNPTTERVV